MAKRPSLAESMKLMQQTATPRSERSPYHAKTRVDMKRVTVPVTPEEHRRLKRLSADAARSIEDLMREALADLFAKHASVDRFS